MTHHITIENTSESKYFATSLTNFIDQGDLITFEGELGTGKTFIIAQIIRTLLSNEEITISSPTFNLVHNYSSPKGNIWHFDLYRLKAPEEVYELGYEDTFSGITLIEWPQIISHILPKDRLDIKIIAGNDEKREILLNPVGLWIEKLKRFSDEYKSKKK